MQKLIYAVGLFVVYTHGRAITSVEDGELLARDAATTSPFHKCLSTGLSVEHCLQEASLTTPNPAKRGALGTVSSALGSITWDNLKFGGEETCYKSLQDTYSWVKIIDVDSAISTACSQVVPKAISAVTAGDYKHATWTGTVASLVVNAYQVPFYLTLAIKGADLLANGKLADMAMSSCQDAVKHLLSDKDCLAKHKEGESPNGGQVIRTLKPGQLLQTILEFGDMNGPQDECKFHYKVVLDSFDIKGKEFDQNKLGAGGSTLRSKISSCGAITAWKFSSPGADGYQWSASGNLPIGTKDCVSKAIKAVGGTAACSGSS